MRITNTNLASHIINKKAADEVVNYYCIKEWSDELNGKRNHNEWSNSRIELICCKDLGFNDIVPIEELVLYVAIKHLRSEVKKHPKGTISDNIYNLIKTGVDKLINDFERHQSHNKLASILVIKELKTELADAMKLHLDYHSE